jgi:hypothetical protein
LWKSVRKQCAPKAFVHKNFSRKRLCVVTHRNGKDRRRATASGIQGVPV